MKYARIAMLVAATTLTSAAAYAECYGNVYSMNAGRGHVGALLDVQESKEMGSQYFLDASERMLLDSKALFSASSMAYDANSDRIYYASVPAPVTYHVEGVESVFTEEELKALDFQASTSTKFQLAYFDVASGTHHLAADTKYQILRMAFDPATGVLYASDANRLFTVDTVSGEMVQVALFPMNVRLGGYTNWGDFEFVDGELLFVTNTRTFVVNTETADLTLLAFHNLDFVAGVTKDQNNQLLVTTKNQNVSGNVNTNRIWRLKPSTGEIVSVGIFPARISAMATVTSETHTCYDTTVFVSDAKTELSGLTASSTAVSEGFTADFTVSFAKETVGTSNTINLALVSGSAHLNSDYKNAVTLTFSDNSTASATLSATGTEIALPSGVDSFKISVSTVNDSTFEQNENFSVQAWLEDDKSDLKSASVTIRDNDVDVDGLLTDAASKGEVTWHGINIIYFSLDKNIEGIHASLGGTIPRGTTLEFYLDGTKLNSFTINGSGKYYERGPNDMRRMQFGQVVSARLVGTNGKTYYVKGGISLVGVSILGGKSVPVDCSNGCN
ncbi:Calx-beta domain-containing protein [Enterovibrio sp. 27052020O]|uniref:Calx-beta domain-containing protein n=1 Tax=Enterovibrio sp. 27052020O TaxID=3241166 RepID=UPI0038907F95